jgi:hypothetical protein
VSPAAVILTTGQSALGVAPPPGDHRRLGAADPRGDLLARRALAPRPPLQLPMIGFPNLDRAHVRGHEKW